MSEINQALLARKYAVAFVNVFGSHIPPEKIPAIKKAIQLLLAKKNLPFFLHLPYLDEKRKYNALADIIFNQAGLPEVFQQLIELLLAHKRSEIFTLVLRSIYELLKVQKNIQHFIITSSAPLDQKELADITSFLAHTTKATISYETAIDQDMIAGLRLQSRSYFWEHSVQKYLKDIKQVLTP